jgi:hypothetical protein
MTKEDYDKATTLQKQIENCDKLLKLFDLDDKMPRTQYVSIIEDNRNLYLKLSVDVEEFKKELEEQFKNL